MGEREKEPESKGFKVNDRRRFDLDGSMKADAPPDVPRPPDPVLPPKAAAAPQAAPKAAAAPQAQAPQQAAPAQKPLPQAPPDALEEDDMDDAGPGGGGLDFLGFLQSLGQQALMQLGLVPYPDTGLVEQSLPLARQTIDILAMLQAKTRGNLNPKEDRFMEALVYDLRMAYVKVTEAAMKQAMPDLKKGGPGMRR